MHSALSTPSSGNRAAPLPTRRDQRSRRLGLEQLERRDLMASIQGMVWNDVSGDGLQQTGEPGLAGWTEFLDLNGNGVRDRETRTVNSSGSAVAIPDAGKKTVSLTISGFVTTLSDVNVKLNINHAADNDLDVFLISPRGTRVELFTDVGSRNRNFTNTTLDDQAATGIASGSAPFSGSYRPERSLSALNGQNPNGTWKLEITDDAGSKTGSLVNWSLALRGQDEPAAVSSAAGSYSFTGLPAGTFQVREVLQPDWVKTFPTAASHSVTLTSSQNVTGRNFGNRYVPTTGEIRGSVWNDLDGDAVRDASEPGRSGRSVYLDLDGDATWDSESLSSASANVPRAIADLATTTSTLPISGLASPITDVDVMLTINHTYDGDLNAYLVSPAGTRVTLFTRIGGAADNFNGTTLDDQAATAVAAGSALSPAAFARQARCRPSTAKPPTARGLWKCSTTRRTTWAAW